jgi:hypothetical protein
MISAKEKAIELVDKHYSYLKANLMYDEEAKEDAIQSALITVNELIKETGSKYYYDVKKEIEKL